MIPAVLKIFKVTNFIPPPTLRKIIHHIFSVLKFLKFFLDLERILKKFLSKRFMTILRYSNINI